MNTVWAGLGKAHSGDLLLFGAHDLEARLYYLGGGSPIRHANINISGYKLGLGLGASVSLVFVLAHGYASASEIAGTSGGWDFEIDIGAKLGDVLKGVKGLGRVIDTMEKFEKLKYAAENAIKNLGITKPGIYTIPIPGPGIGLHLWAGFAFGDVTLISAGQGLP